MKTSKDYWKRIAEALDTSIGEVTVKKRREGLCVQGEGISKRFAPSRRLGKCKMPSWSLMMKPICG